jgi:pimeloyl-ACP methyl ester carboxylesterase
VILMTLVLQIGAAIIALLFLIRAVNLIILMRWYQKPLPPGSTVDVDGRKVYCTLKGAGAPTVLIEAAMGAVSPEWWMIQEELARTTRVLTYDRAGYGWSGPADEPRSSAAEAAELKELIDELEIDGPIVLVGHSLGGLLVNHFARLFPEMVGAVVLIDPASPDNERFRKELSPTVFQKSGVDKVGALKMLMWFNGFGFTRLLKRFFLKPYSPGGTLQVPAETLSVLWHHMLLPQTPRIAFDEYLQLQKQGPLQNLKSPDGFPRVPLRVMTHSSEQMIDQIAGHGGLTEDEAKQVESLWQELIRAHTQLAPDSRLVIAAASCHNIHLDEPELVVKTILELVEAVRRSHYGGAGKPESV